MTSDFHIFGNIVLLSPYYLGLLFLLPIFLFLFYKGQKKQVLNIASYNDIKKIYKRGNIIFYSQMILISLIYIIGVFLLANPNEQNTDEKVKKNGIDIVLDFDISTSMLAGDLLPDRLTVAKKAIIDFLKKQETNRVGLVVFAGKPFTSIPLTFDYGILEESVERMSVDTINQVNFGGTAIGDALLSSKNLFDKDEEKDEEREKVIILLTDGDANVGVNPLVVAKSLKLEKIKVYTIGIGSEKGGYISQKVGPFLQKVAVAPLNGKALQEIANITGGKYFRPTDKRSLEDVFEELEKLEKRDIEIDIEKQYKDKYDEYVLVMLILLGGLLLTYFIRPRS